MKNKPKVWLNNKIIPWEDAKVPILSHGFSRGSAVFEVCGTHVVPDGIAAFRMDAHLKRLEQTVSLLGMELGFSIQEIIKAVSEITAVNNTYLEKNELKVILLGSAPLLIQRGLTESLAGRFQILHLPHWSFSEMRSCFGWDLYTYLFYGGYPGAAPLITDPQRWSRYIIDALIETTISRDVLLLTRVDKPALLRRLFELACNYSGQILSYTKMLGQLQEAGNTTTLAHYLDLLAGAGIVMGIQKYSGSKVRRRGSSPKLQVLNTALMTAQSGLSMEEARSDGSFWRRLVESAVGAHLVNAQSAGTCKVFYWREGNREVDFVAQAGRRLTAIEVKSGRTRGTFPGMEAFSDAFKPTRKLLVGGDGIPISGFLKEPVEHWVKA